jgi:uncharacterized SAM-binding protein YcdF (DUF218 family)
MTLILLSLRYFSLSIASSIALWLLGFCLFAITLPNAPKDMTLKTDAIVVLTGGKGRVELGFSLFNAGLGKRLFISGVHPGVKAHTLASKQKVPTHLTQRLSEAELEYVAQNTAENAIETAKWVKTHNITSIRLVTGDYHVQRSLIEFKKLLPGVFVIAHPVHAKHKSSFKKINLLWNEYVKLCFIWVKYQLNLQNYSSQ